MITIELNGEQREIDEDQCMEALISTLDLANQALAVAINREVVPRRQWPKRVLRQNDRVDIVRAIGGG